MKLKLRELSPDEIGRELKMIEEANLRHEKLCGMAGEKIWRNSPGYEPASKKKTQPEIWAHHRRLEAERAFLRDWSNAL